MLHNEQSSLLPDIENNDIYDNTEQVKIPDEAEGKTASVSATTINITKVCIGTGVLVLPYAARTGGYALYLLVIFVVAS